MKFKSNLVTQASGSIGGLTASRNKGGMYLRARAIPTNPNTPAQAAVRAIFQALSSVWTNVLTTPQRVAWDSYAAAVPLLDTLGESRNVTGLNMYIRSNTPRIQAGLSRIDAAPADNSLPLLTAPAITSITAATRVAILTFINGDAWATAVGGALLVYTSRPQNASIIGFKGPFQYAGRVNGAVVPPTSPSNVTTVFPVTASKVIWFRFVAVTADGRLSADIVKSSTAI